MYIYSCEFLPFYSSVNNTVTCFYIFLKPYINSKYNKRARCIPSFAWASSCRIKEWLHKSAIITEHPITLTTE